MALTPKELEFCSYIEQCWLADSEIPSYEKVASKLGLLTRREFDKFWGAESVRKYLSKVGIDIERILADTTDILTPIQLLTINTLLDFNDPRPDHRKLQQLNVSGKTFDAWKRDPAFASYYRKRIENLTKDSHEIDRALFERSKDGDVAAIKYYNEFTNRYRPQQLAGGQSVADVRILVLRIQEVLLRNLQDQPELLQRIGLELESISNMQDPVGEPVIIQPETKAIGF